MTSDRLVVPLSKTKIVMLLLGAVAFVAVSVWLWSIADHQTRRSPALVRAVAVAGAGFFGLCGAVGLTKLFDTTPGLIIDAEGIVDNSSGVSAGRIPWRDIRGIHITTTNGQRFLTVELENPHQYLQAGGFLKRQLSAANLKYFGSPIQISANALQVDFEELQKAVVRFHERYKGA